ncbi:hypothetical protein DXG01_013111 [Tephrocybe rancida]|nr:hypothetical protein DXG01_013111 [Tephrocybe rancida]
MSLRNQSPPAHQLVRTLWTEFEHWANKQRKLLERRRADITYALDAEWKTTPERKRNKANHDEKTRNALQRASEDHTDMLLTEWQRRAEAQNLGPDAWGTRTLEEDKRIGSLFQTDDALKRLSEPVVQYTQPQSTPAYNPAPPMTSTARSVNLSSSSYQVVDPSSFSNDDDDGYDAEESYVATTDESGDEGYVPVAVNSRSVHAKFPSHNSQNGSPDYLSSSGSSAYETVPPTSFPSRPEINLDPPKRPPDTTDRKGKARAREPAYVGPYLSSPEDSSDEDDFKTFKMQTRIDKIWEFHHAAAQADVELVIAISNDRMSKKSFDNEARISQHEKRMRELQADKEVERKATVDAERKKRREEISKRPTFSDRSQITNIQSANAHSQLDWESKFMTGQSVHLDAEKNAFILGLPSSPEENKDWSTMPSETWPDTRSSAPSENFGTVRARRKSQTSATPSGWKTKHTPSPPTTTSTQVHAAPSNMESMQWYDRSDELFERDAFPPQKATSDLPMPAGWGEKPSPSATSLLKKVLSDPPSHRKHSLLSSAEPHQSPFTHAVDPKPTPGFASTAKKPIKAARGRQALHGPGNLDHAEAESPTTPTVNARAFASSAVQPKDMHPRHTQNHADDEMSSTPRPLGFLKRAMADYASDVGGSTPKVGGIGRIGEMPMASGLGSSSWTMHEADVHARHGQPPASQYDDDDDGWGLAQLAQKAMDEIMPQEDTPWNMMMRHQESQQARREESAWGRGSQAAPSRLPAKKPPPPGPTPWDQQANPRAQHTQPMSASSQAPEAPGEDFWKAAMSQLQTQPQEPDVQESPWERMQRLRAQGALPGSEAPPARTGLHSSKPSWSGLTNFDPPVADAVYQQPSAPPPQSSNQFWTPNGGHGASQMWNQNAQSTKQSTTMPGGYAFDTPQGYERFGQASSMQGNTRMSSSYSKHPTVEDEPDEEAPGGRYAQREALPYNSRVLLDIAVPKPSHPPNAFSDVIEFSDEFDEGEYDNSLSSAVPTPSTAPTSPPAEIAAMSDEEWTMSAADNAKNGHFGPASNQKPTSMWSSGPPAKQSAWGTQKLDSAKLRSALQSVPSATTTPPKAAPASAPEPAPAAASPPASKLEETASTKAPAAPEKSEPAVKNGNQNQKGKKGKGKGKR